VDFRLRQAEISRDFNVRRAELDDRGLNRARGVRCYPAGQLIDLAAVDTYLKS
jgi:hypothetical protein